MSNDTNLQEILSGGTGLRRLDGRDARRANFRAGRALAEIVETTLGPRGLDKLLLTSEGKAVVTNDGASIVDRMSIDHPAAKAIVQVANQQQSFARDGTTSAIVIAGELLRRAEALIEEGVHPTSIAQGYHLAAQRTRETLREQAIPVDPDDDRQLRDVAKTVVTGKWDDDASEFLAANAVDAVLAIERDGTVDFRRITRTAIPGRSYYDSELVEGLVVDTDSSSTTAVSPEAALPRTFENATVALVDNQLTIETVEGQGAVTPGGPEQLQAFREYEREVYERYVDRIVDAGATVVFCQKSIDDPIRYLLADEGILAVERTRQDELHKLGRTTGARPVGTVDDLQAEDVGRARRVERRDVGPTELAIVVGEDDVRQVSLILRGGTQHVADETKRVIDSCFHVLKHALEDGLVLPGGAAAEVHVANDLRDYAASVSGREQLAIEAFADALEVIPRTLASTAGHDPIDVLTELRARHHGGDLTAGLVLETGAADDMIARGVIEPLVVREHAIVAASEAANVLIRVDDVITSTHAGDDEDHDHDHDHDRGHGDLVESPHGYPWAIGH